MGVIINISEALARSEFNILQEPIKMRLEKEQERFEKESLIKDIYIMNTIDKYMEEYRSSTSMDGFTPTEDLEVAKISDTDENYGKIFDTQIWTNSFVISKQTLEDQSNMTIQRKTSQFIAGYNRTRELYAFAMLSGALSGSVEFGGKSFDCTGFDTTDGTISGTKQVFFHNAHKSPIVGVADQSNKFRASIDLDATTAHSKMLSLIGQVETTMSNYTDAKGNVLNVNPTTLILPNHYKLKNILMTALKTQYTEAMGDNGINIQYGKWKIITTPYLSKLPGFKEEDQAFIMMDPVSNRDFMGALWFDRTPLTVRSYIDNDTEANVWAGRGRYKAHFGDFRAMSYISCKELANGEDLATVAAAQNATAITV